MYPLLIQGVFSSPGGANETLTPGGGLFNAGWSNNIKTGRGDLVVVDPVTTFVTPGEENINLGTFTYQIGGQAVLDGCNLGRYQAIARPRSNELLQMRQPGGQSVKLLFNNIGSGPGLMIHHYFENNFATREIIAARNISILKQRIKDTSATFIAGVKTATPVTGVIPKGIGNVVAIEFFVSGNGAQTYKSLQACLFSFSVGGISIIEDGNCSIFTATGARPGLIFPILIRGGETFAFGANTVAGLGPTVITARLYFDDDQNGTKQYLDTIC
jgi:hypothetical protein